MSELIKVSAKSRSTAVAGAIAGVMRESGFAELQAIGASAVNQSIKALAIARGYLKEDRIDIAAVPSFTEVTIQGAERTAVHMAIYKQSVLFDPDEERVPTQSNGYPEKDRIHTPIIVTS